MINENIPREEYIEIPNLPRKIMPNHILVKLDVINKNKRTASGIWLASGRPDERLDSTDIYHQIDRVGTVKMVSDVIFDINNDEGIDFDTEMELNIGDHVWIRQVEANAAIRLLYKGEKYKIVRYDALTVAKRGKKVIPLNGNILMTEVFAPPSKWILMNQIPLAGQGKIKYIGTPNKDYKFNYAKKMSGVVKIGDTKDDFDAKVGQKVEYELLPGMKLDLYLESDLFGIFGEKIKICQRKDIIRELK